MRIGLALFAFAVATPAMAMDDDAAALSLADQGVAPAHPSRDWRAFVEGTAGQSALRPDGTRNDANLFLGLRLDKAVAPDWRAIVADLLDVRRRDSSGETNVVNTLIDAYLSWQIRSDVIVDAGRINTRYGVGVGYNPTDYFRANAIRSVISVDPESLRENRQGSVMTRGQLLWSQGALTAMYSPKLADHTSAAAFNPDFGATNFADRWLLAVSQQVSRQLNPQVLVYGQAGRSPQFGANLTMLVNDAMVVHGEYSGGRSTSLLAETEMLPGNAVFRSQLSLGATYTTANNVSLTVEYQYNGRGLDEASWNALRSAPPTVYGRYRVLASALQEPPTKRRVFANARWQDAFVNHLDLATFAYYDCVDSSRQSWVEARYHWPVVDLALQWQVNSGSPGSEYGALPARQSWQILFKYFF